MDPQHWAMRFKRNPADVMLVKEVAKNQIYETRQASIYARRMA